MGDDADLLALGLQDRALLDVQLEHRMHLARADRLVAHPADALQLVAEALALGVRAVIGVVLRRGRPAKTPDASMAGAKRAPSSLVQLVTTIGCFVLMPRSFIVRTTSSAPRTPSTPSYLPPVGWVSRWLPI